MKTFKKYSKKDYMRLIARAIEEVTDDKCLIIFFGSIIGNKFNRTSDIDVAIYCREDLTPEKILKIEDAIEKLPILREVDLVDLKEVKDINFIQNIMKGKVWKNIPELLKDLEEHIRNLKK